ncbi:MAG TPA: DUF4360 domain-containing protein [Bdellovibrionales bacterium]|nr:DUF4360 domain-containing protein [Bdellovibrionales bacterium]
MNLSRKAIWELIACTAIAAAAGTAQAQVPDIRLGQPGHGGPGCPQGSVSVTLSPDEKALTILFDQFVVEAGGPEGKPMGYSSCNLSIPIHIPQGYSVSILQVDYRGYNSLPRGANSTLSTNYFFNAQGGSNRGVTLSRQFRGPADAPYLVTDRLAAEAVVWTPCGAEANLRVNTNMRVSSPRRDYAMSTVDSADISAGLVYHIQWRRCR